MKYELANEILRSEISNKLLYMFFASREGTAVNMMWNGVLEKHWWKKPYILTY
jgi:hypothetical protein